VGFKETSGKLNLESCLKFQLPAVGFKVIGNIFIENISERFELPAVGFKVIGNIFIENISLRFELPAVGFKLFWINWIYSIV